MLGKMGTSNNKAQAKGNNVKDMRKSVRLSVCNVVNFDLDAAVDKYGFETGKRRGAFHQMTPEEQEQQRQKERDARKKREAARSYLMMRNTAGHAGLIQGSILIQENKFEAAAVQLESAFKNFLPSLRVRFHEQNLGKVPTEDLEEMMEEAKEEDARNNASSSESENALSVTDDEAEKLQPTQAVSELGDKVAEELDRSLGASQGAAHAVIFDSGRTTSKVPQKSVLPPISQSEPEAKRDETDDGEEDEEAPAPSENARFNETTFPRTPLLLPPIEETDRFKSVAYLTAKQQYASQPKQMRQKGGRVRILSGTGRAGTSNSDNGIKVSIEEIEVLDSEEGSSSTSSEFNVHDDSDFEDGSSGDSSGDNSDSDSDSKSDDSDDSDDSDEDESGGEDDGGSGDSEKKAKAKRKKKKAAQKAKQAEEKKLDDLRALYNSSMMPTDDPGTTKNTEESKEAKEHNDAYKPGPYQLCYLVQAYCIALEKLERWTDLDEFAETVTQLLGDAGVNGLPILNDPLTERTFVHIMTRRAAAIIQQGPDEYSRALGYFDLALRANPKHRMAARGRELLRFLRNQLESEAVWKVAQALAALLSSNMNDVRTEGREAERLPWHLGVATSAGNSNFTSTRRRRR